ncbi:MAG: hypothetical protein A2729_03765 [Candidatus Buchananbacteria bacterium RIFCSPHIGHO2_01_FULL_39_14]|uniref:Uncharacterized protein n=2 Tax=Candidatus Buchananiibacteriota TaxID=1817903 RepID=A0A1G1YPQ4_9BACT|nr:MAG: hypothetical protein A2729_03765 [Candidatus Buchananbacteria bacterium RIFCSPHIGHO2_01_FULL_39_14]OGY48494.1 MAG: hypothetical protein A3D39_04945 [Candidatus Buchananbacteria bacterium RIFCSPHIGHO2_02_FULL_39_17]OGY54249.1 MAG: hypothetical protein A2912_04375 [Candidatus Buchananbacteria bacterium RIFCSPLOWO2_01_FULL_40_23b]
MTDKLFNFFNDNPTLITHCPVCNLRFNPLEAKVLEEGENTHLVYIKCRHCQASILALISASQLGISSVGLITDLSGDDIMKFKEMSPITFDDVIESHQFLRREKALIEYLD